MQNIVAAVVVFQGCFFLEGGGGGGGVHDAVVGLEGTCDQ